MCNRAQELESVLKAIKCLLQVALLSDELLNFVAKIPSPYIFEVNFIDWFEKYFEEGLAQFKSFFLKKKY